MGSFSIWHLLILLIVVVLIFGTKRLTGGAKDVADAVKEFKKAMHDDGQPKPDSKVTDPIQQAVDPTRPPPADVTRVQRPPSSVAPSDDQHPRS
jgi:sec-independent protein translocase protein TatA